MKILIQLVASLAGTIGFALIFRVNLKRVPFAALGGVMTCGVYLLAAHFLQYEFLQLLIPSVFATAYSEVFARILKTPASTLLLPSIITLVPGGALYYTMSDLVAGNAAKFYSSAYLTAEMAAGIAVGVILVSVIVNSLTNRKERKLDGDRLTSVDRKN